MRKNHKRKFTNANPPRRCRAVPAVLEQSAIATAQAILDASGTRVKPSEAGFRVDFSGKEPVITLGSRFYRKWEKQATFKLPPTDSFGTRPLVRA